MFAFSMGYQMTCLCKSLNANVTYMGLFLLMNCFEMSFHSSLCHKRFFTNRTLHPFPFMSNFNVTSQHIFVFESFVTLFTFMGFLSFNFMVALYVKILGNILSSNVKDLSNDTKHDISWKYPSDTFDFIFKGSAKLHVIWQNSSAKLRFIWRNGSAK